MRQRDPLTADELRELDALERALAGDPVDPDLFELEQLVHDVRATAPEMSPGFAARLEHQASEGFPASGAQPARRRPRRWMLIPAGGTFAAALVGLVVVLGASDDTSTFSGRSIALDGAPNASGGAAVQDDDGSAARESSGGSDTAAQSQDSSGRGAAEPAPAAPGTAAAPGAGSSAAADPAAPSVTTRAKRAPSVGTKPGPRKVQRSAQLVLTVPNDRVDSTTDGVIRTVDRFDGIVATSSSSTQGRHGEATFDLRIPTDRLDDALAALSKLGHVSERHQDLVDITGSFTSVQDRLSDARAERRGLLKALGRASTQQQIDSLRARLRTVRSQIARLNGDLDALRRRADLSTVSVTVRGTAKGSGGGAAGDGGNWSPGDAARDAVRVLEVSAGVALVALAVLVPLALLGAIGALGVRAAGRRRRESALDAA